MGKYPPGQLAVITGTLPPVRHDHPAAVIFDRIFLGAVFWRYGLVHAGRSGVVFAVVTRAVFTATGDDRLAASASPGLPDPAAVVGRSLTPCI